MAPQTAAPSSLEVRRVIRAPRKRFFEAWTKPEELKRWHAPGPLTVSLAEMDVRTGGSYRIHMREPDGREPGVANEPRAIRQSERGDGRVVQRAF